VLNRLLNQFVRPVSAQAFTAEAADCVKALNAGAKVEIVAPLELTAKRTADDKPLEIHLANAYALYLKQRKQRGEIIHRYVSAMLEADVEDLIPKNVIPTIKDKDYLEEISAQIQSKGGKPGEFMVTEEYNSDLVILYAVDAPRSIRFLTPADLAELNLHGESLRSFAIGNLKKILPPVEVHGKPPFFALKAGGMFESSLILLDRVWDKKELRIEGEIAVALPARDTLLVADTSDTRAVARLRKNAAEIASAAAYRLTRKVFVRRESGFEVLA
jgi:uncharacterized protein YtpQ (UPF0354 family)